jgi:hypothetical protein
MDYEIFSYFGALLLNIISIQNAHGMGHKNSKLVVSSSFEFLLCLLNKKIVILLSPYSKCRRWKYLNLYSYISHKNEIEKRIWLVLNTLPLFLTSNTHGRERVRVFIQIHWQQVWKINKIIDFVRRLMRGDDFMCEIFSAN